MTVGIDTFALGDADSILRSEIEKAFEGKNGNWHVSVIGDQQNTIWQIKVDGPAGFKWIKDFTEGREHSAAFIRDAIRDALP